MEKIYTRVMVAMLALIMAVSFSACSDDDDDEAPKTGNVVGTWVNVQKYHEGQSNEVTETITYVFRNDGHGSYEEVSVSLSGAKSTDSYTFQYTLAQGSDGVLTIVVTEDEDKTKHTFKATQTGNILSLNGVNFTRK